MFGPTRIRPRHVLGSAIAATLASSPAHAIDLLPTVPVVQSTVWAQTYQSGTLYLNALDASYDVNKNTDYRYDNTTTRGATASLGSLDPNQPGISMNQYDHSTTVVRAHAQSDFGVNKTWVQMDGNLAPNYDYHSDGTVAPSSGYADRYINNFNYGTATSVYDSATNRDIQVASGVGYQQDPNTGAVTFNDAKGMVYSPSWNSSTNYFVPSAPEVELHLNSYRSVTAYSRWEDMFYFHGGPGAAGTPGVATVHVQLDGNLNGADYAGSLQFIARDWANKDSGNYLASRYIPQLAGGQAVNEDITLEISFLYDQPAYIKAEVWASLGGEGNIDFFNTAKITSIDVPTGTVVYDYGLYLFGGTGNYSVNGGVNGNGLPNGGNNYFNGGGNGGGGGGNPVPLPASVWMLLSAAGALGGLRRRA